MICQFWKFGPDSATLAHFQHNFWKLLEISEGHAINVLVIEQGSINSYRRRQDVTRNKMTLKLIHLSAFATALQFIVPKLLYKY